MAGDRKRLLAKIASVLQGRVVFLLEQENNTNRLHKNRNLHVVQDSINNTWLHRNPNFYVVKDSIKNTHDTIVL